MSTEFEVDSQWSDDLITGVSEIDKQHVEFFARIAAIQTAVKAGKTSSEVESLIGYLEEYTQRHTALEEGYMHRYKFSEADVHRAEHDELRAAVRALRAKLVESGPDKKVVNSSLRVLTEWLSVHIRDTDLVLAKFLREVDQPS